MGSKGLCSPQRVKIETLGKNRLVNEKPVIRLALKEVTKTFGATTALSGVNLSVRSGSSHALIGENGAGKSTLMKIISGAHNLDSGEMYLDGEAFLPKHPIDARKAGVAMIYQELNLVSDLDAIENITLGAEPARHGVLHLKKRRSIALQALEKLQYTSLPLGIPVAHLTIAQKQIIEIARALIHNPKILILDEPTSSLTKVDAEKLFQTLKKLKSQGVSIIYISHFLEECQEVCDDFTVLRDGATVDQGLMSERNLGQIMTAMVGRDISDIYPEPPDSLRSETLSVHQLKGEKKPKNVTFKIRKGEVFGIAGLVGAGRTECLRTIFGLDTKVSGDIFLEGKKNRVTSPHSSLANGMGLVSEDRKDEGLLLDQSLADNLTMTRFKPVSRWGLISNKLQNKETQHWIDKLQVKATHPQQSISQLSGGNQQKIAIGRILYHGAEILLLDEPTRGIDVGSKAQIYQLICDLAKEGKSVVFVSSYLPELLGICHTIGVMNRGNLSEIRPTDKWDEQSLIEAAIKTA